MDSFGDHLQTFQVKSVVTQVHDWVVYRLGGILGSVGHRVKIHKITPATGKERGDLEILANTRRSDGAPDPDGCLLLIDKARAKDKTYI